jgi:glycosyltransferase involved in cell wall biosynthesis
MSSMVFHFPRRIEEGPTVGSSTHVVRMLEAFRAIGYDVTVVAGESKERSSAMRALRKELTSGRVFDFVYSEASTSPTALNDSHHLPVRPLCDYRFFAAMRGLGIPIGLFYPDVYWRFPVYRAAVPLIKRRTAYLFYHFDLRWYSKVLDVIFLPSQRMAEHVPGSERFRAIEALAPGGSTQLLPHTESEQDLHLFYVGSVTPPIYDISPLMSAVSQTPGVQLTVCCPRSERLPSGASGLERVHFVHEHGDQLLERYRESEIACLIFEPDPYRDFAMPVKLFEALGFGRPVLASAGTAVGDYVSEQRVGWTVNNASLAETLATLRDDRALIRACQQHVVRLQPSVSWNARATEVADRLSRGRGTS